MRGAGPGLRRSLGWQEGAGFTVAAVLGTGVLVLPAVTASLAGPAALVAWALMAVMAAPMALTLGDLAVRLPDAGGIAAYARAAFGPRAGRAVGLLYLGTVPVGAPAAALIGSGYVTAYFGWPPLVGVAIAAAMLATALGANAVGVELSGRAATAVVVAIALILAAAVATALPHAALERLTPFAPHGWVPVGASFALLYWALVGWEMVGHMAEEFTDPARDLGRAMLASLAVVDVLYLAVAAATVGTGTYGHGRSADGLALLVGLSLGRWGARATAALALLVTYATTHTYIAGFSRLVYAQARQGDMPGWLAVLNARRQTPIRVLAVMAVPFAVVLAYDAVRPFSLAALIAWPSAIFIGLYITAMAAGVRLLPRWRQRLAATAGGLVSLAALPFTGFAAALPVIVFALALARSRPTRAPAP